MKYREPEHFKLVYYGVFGGMFRRQVFIFTNPHLIGRHLEREYRKQATMLN